MYDFLRVWWRWILGGGENGWGVLGMMGYIAEFSTFTLSSLGNPWGST